MAAGPMREEVGAMEVFPGANVTTDAQIEEAIRNAGSSTWAHPVGTASMMPRRLGGVVDPRLCVYGTSGLRVVDASVMPLVPGTHTASPVFAVADHAASIQDGAAAKRHRLVDSSGEEGQTQQNVPLSPPSEILPPFNRRSIYSFFVRRTRLIRSTPPLLSAMAILLFLLITYESHIYFDVREAPSPP